MTTNWAGNVTFTPSLIHRPSTVDQLRDLVANARHVRALGTGHSFNRLADTPGTLVSVTDLPPVMDIDTDRATVTVTAGIRYGELAEHLHAAGHALHNLGSLPHISIAGACATATHGSGDRNGNLATAVSAMELVTGDGDLTTLDRQDHDFAGTVVGLGALGIVTSLTLDITPTYAIRQYVYDNLPRDQLDRHFEDIFASAYSVSLFTDWTAPRINQVWLKHRVGPDHPPSSGPPPDPRWMGATLADAPRHPIPAMSAANCTQQLGVPGPWHTRLPHFRLEFTPSSGDELQSEYFVPRHLALDAIAAIEQIRDRVTPVLQVSEIRTVASDNLWMSPAHGRDSVAIHFTWLKDTHAVTPVLTALEHQLAPFAARPHWGKLFSTSPETMTDLYDRHPDFRRLLHDRDPAGKFRNDLLDRYFPLAL